MGFRTTIVAMLLAGSVAVQSASAAEDAPRPVRARVTSLKQLGRLFAVQRDPLTIRIRGDIEVGSSLLVRLLNQIRQMPDACALDEYGLPRLIGVSDFRKALEILQGRKKIEPVVEEPAPIIEKPVVAERPEVDYWESARATLNLTVSASMKAADGADVVVLKNGSILRAGETVQANYEGRTYRWTVTSVANGHISLEKLP